ncbi:armadillo repeat protein [Xylariaceae sp. FL0594]|nr:armadillo repeat protein [Xylariaceae sp. FL0594]
MELDPQTVLAQLNGGSPSDQISALRLLKNDVIGDIRKKTLWVRHGILPHIRRLLSSRASGADTAESRARGTTQPSNFFGDDGADQSIQLLALQLLGAFANTGPAFLSPLHASGVLPAVLSDSCLQHGNSQIRHAALRVLQYIAIATETAQPESPISPLSLADAIFSENHVPSLTSILTQRESSYSIEQQTGIVAYLIRSLCLEERHRVALVEGGVLDGLATRLASVAVVEGHVLPKAELYAELEGLGGYIPKPALSSEHLCELLGAIGTIVTDSPYRAGRLVYSPSIHAIFPVLGRNRTQYPKSPVEATVLPGLKPTKPKEPEIMDSLLPVTPGRMFGHGGFMSTFDAIFGEGNSPSSRPSAKLQTSLISWTPPEENGLRNTDTVLADAETPLVPWLIYLVRTRKASEILMASLVLASLYKVGFSHKSREADICLLVVPPIVELLESQMAKSKQSKDTSQRRKALARLDIAEVAPLVLARLITDSEAMQKAAFEAGAVKVLARLLKDTHSESQYAAESQLWILDQDSVHVPGDGAPECRLGPEGLPPQVIHRRRVRESTMTALGALASFKEDIRKAIVDQDVMDYLIDSLKPFSGPVHQQPQGQARPSPNGHSSRGDSPGEAERNPVPVILAGCYLLRTLSRSVSVLRTTLVDHSAETPILELLTHPCVDVQVAATACVCNLLPEFSPIRDTLVSRGVVEILCEHTHSQNSALRLNALWALKHVVNAASVEFKKRCLEELESGWLIQLISDDVGNSTPDTPDVMDEDVDMGIPEEQARPWLSSSFYAPASISDSHAGGQSGQPRNRILTLAQSLVERLKESENSPARKTRQDELAIQEQGLGFIRNLIGNAPMKESSADMTEMIDHLLMVFGQDRLFGILASKLKPRVTHPLSRRGTDGDARVLPPQSKMISAVIYVLIHIAAGIPRHRQLVIAQTDLLKQLPRLFGNQDSEVRVALCHLVNNLTWEDDCSDHAACTQRTLELKNLGFLKKLETLGSSDEELDVRERAKSALWQMKNGD